MSPAAGKSDSGVYRDALRLVRCEAVHLEMAENWILPPAAVSRCSRWRLAGGWASIAGRRMTNEDCGYVNIRDGVFLVADGVGGTQGGEEASHLLANMIPSQLTPQLGNSATPDAALPEMIREAVCAAQQALSRLASRSPRLSDMGSTLALGVISGANLYFTHLGDSRIYLIRDGQIVRLTRDHSVVQALIDAGCIPLESAKRHPLRHVITESVNVRRAPQVEVRIQELLAGDRLLLTTDGLTDAVPDAQLADTVQRHSNPQEAAESLVGQALDGRSSDNITCIVVQLERGNS